MSLAFVFPLFQLRIQKIESSWKRPSISSINAHTFFVHNFFYLQHNLLAPLNWSNRKLFVLIKSSCQLLEIRKKGCPLEKGTSLKIFISIYWYHGFNLYITHLDIKLKLTKILNILLFLEGILRPMHSSPWSYSPLTRSLCWDCLILKLLQTKMWYK